MTDHPITPPAELVQQLRNAAALSGNGDYVDRLVIAGYLAGADQELEACCEWVSHWRVMVNGLRPEVELRAARRPKPKSLAEEALEALKPLSIGMIDDGTNAATIRSALKRLQELETTN